jgi:hypothetical protein
MAAGTSLFVAYVYDTAFVSSAEATHSVLSESLFVVLSNSQAYRRASVIPPLLFVFGVYLFLRARWPESFYGALLAIGATPLWALCAASIHCPVCGHCVGLGAPFGRWRSYLESLQTCPRCGDDGEARPVAPGELTVWQQAERAFAERERARRRRRAPAVWIATVVAAVALGLAVLLSR